MYQREEKVTGEIKEIEEIPKQKHPDSGGEVFYVLESAHLLLGFTIKIDIGYYGKVGFLQLCEGGF